MSKRGFVYILDNPWMGDLIKVGCTERSPHERAAELSNHTGVPAPFRVVCYIECEDFQAVERSAHQFLERFRISNGRELFYGCLRNAVRFLWWNPKRLAFCDATLDVEGLSSLLVEVSRPDEPPIEGLSDLADPWNPPKPDAEPAQPLKLVSNAEGFE